MLTHNRVTINHKVKYQLICHIYWYGKETCINIIDTFEYKSEAYEEKIYCLHGDYLDREERILPPYIEYTYEVKTIHTPIYEEG